MLEAKNLSKSFVERQKGFFASMKRFTAVDDVSLMIQPGKTLGLVGESGSGKTTLIRMLNGLIVPDAGEVTYDGVNIRTMNPEQLKAFRSDVQMIFQDPMNSLNPRMNVAEVLMEPFEIHPKKERIAPEVLLNEVELDAGVVDRYPHQLSGGERQRVCIARALALRPRLVICDEPVTSLDVLVRAQILNLLLRLQEEYKLAYLFVSHDLRVVRHMSDDVLVMEKGKIVESGPRDAVFEAPSHPYTQNLIASMTF